MMSVYEIAYFVRITIENTWNYTSMCVSYELSLGLLIYVQ